ncbi:hypothetical protein ACTJIJ_21930 [Niabella sp. 22666]|uniref:hypothetical protein n=1 Tax=Niabella sp. 22666 TaxID=3453954 RepID=UPI003F8295CB
MTEEMKNDMENANFSLVSINDNRSNTLMLILLILISFAALNNCEGQTLARSSGHSSIKGKIKDSSYNFMLTSATIAVYKDIDSALLQFSTPNSLGEFGIQDLPQGVPLRLIISHIGYHTFFRKLLLNESTPVTDLGQISMRQHSDSDGTLMDEIIVKAIPPMRMNGDTVEFNADAFRLKENSTAEDLMRKLPGFTIWGDGEITYNGKKINAVLVEGKPFMGSSDPTIATQNLPKDALDKIQVYQQHDEKNPLDSTMYANIKLKEDKKMGYFGKLSSGYGTDNRYSAEGMISGFNKKMQVSTVGATNNVNKVADNTDVLVKNASFKGQGINMDYQSNFNMRGLNSPLAGGIKFQYDFIPDAKYQKTSRLNADYFLNINEAIISNINTTKNLLQTDTILSRKSINTNNNKTRANRYNSRYSWDSERMGFILSTSFNESHDMDTGSDISEQEKTGLGVISRSVSANSSDISNRNLQVAAEYNNRQSYSKAAVKRLSSEFTIGYNLSVYDNNRFSRNQTKFESVINPKDNREFDRIYQQRDAKGASQNITVRYPGLTRLIFNKNSLGGVSIDLTGSFSVRNDQYIDRVIDYDVETQNYITNSYLTNNRNSNTKNFQPSIGVGKIIKKGLTNRYNKWLSMRFNFRQQYFSFDHNAAQSFQNLNYNYEYFLPDATIEYSNHQYGSYEVKYGLNFNTIVDYPTLNNIAPLVDSTNLWYIPKGNPNILPQYKKQLAFSYTFTTRTTKNPLNIGIKVALATINNDITDSSIFDNSGVRTVYAVNMDGNKYANSDFSIKKSFELKKGTSLEATGRYNLYKGQNPHYINNSVNLSKSTHHDLLFSLAFRLGDILNLKADQNFALYSSRQEGNEMNGFKSKNNRTRIIAGVKLFDAFSVVSNLSYNKNRSNKSSAVHYTLLNLDVGYRFLKGDNGELKFSALDLLRQNKGVVNTASVNTQTFTISNVLQQYYLLTLSYYPRQFGKRKSK